MRTLLSATVAAAALALPLTAFGGASLPGGRDATGGPGLAFGSRPVGGLLAGAGLQDPGAQAAVKEVREALEAGEPATALSLARDAASRYPESVDARLWLGHAERLAANPVAASAAYRRVLGAEPDHPEALMGLAAVLEATGNLSAARETYDRVVELAPDNPAAKAAAARLHMRSGDHRRAAGLLAGVVELAPEDIESRYLLGMAHYLSGEPEAAIPVFEDVLAADPDYLPAQHSLGVVLAERPEDHDRALELLRAVLEAGWEEASSAYLIGGILADRGDLEAAVPMLRRALELDPEQLNARYRLAGVLRRLGRREEAAEQMERFREAQQEFNAQEAREKERETWRNRLAAELAAGDSRGAAATVEKMLAAFPEDVEVLVQASKVWLSAGMVDRALDAAIAARQLEPGHWEALYLEGMILARRGEHATAADRLRASVSANPLFADTHALLGNVAMELGRLDAAVSSYLAAIDLDPDNPGYYLNLATAYGALGRGDLEADALDAYRRHLKTNGSER